MGTDVWILLEANTCKDFRTQKLYNRDTLRQSGSMDRFDGSGIVLSFQFSVLSLVLSFQYSVRLGLPVPTQAESRPERNNYRKDYYIAAEPALRTDNPTDN
jgi:hypothetical protein